MEAKEWPAPRRQQVRDLLEKGKSIREVAIIMGITSQAAYQHLTALRRKGYVWPKSGSS